MYSFKSLLMRLQQAKSASKLRTEDISAISGIPIGTLSKIFAGITKDPKIGTLIAIAEALNISVDYLIYGKVSKQDISNSELDHIKKYRALDKRGKENVDDTLEREYQYALKKSKDTQNMVI